MHGLWILIVLVMMDILKLLSSNLAKVGTIRVFVTLTGKMAIFEKILRASLYMDIDIYYQIVGRTDYHIDKQRIRLTAEEVQAALVQ